MSPMLCLALNSEDIRHHSQIPSSREDPEGISTLSYKSLTCCFDAVRYKPHGCFFTLSREQVHPTLQEYVEGQQLKNSALYFRSKQSLTSFSPGGASWRYLCLFCPFKTPETLPSLSVVGSQRRAADMNIICRRYFSSNCLHSYTRAAKCAKELMCISGQECHRASERFQVSKGSFCVCARRVF